MDNRPEPGLQFDAHRGKTLQGCAEQLSIPVMQQVVMKEEYRLDWLKDQPKRSAEAIKGMRRCQGICLLTVATPPWTSVHSTIYLLDRPRVVSGLAVTHKRQHPCWRENRGQLASLPGSHCEKLNPDLIFDWGRRTAGGMR
jgi:hypothetical protein